MNGGVSLIKASISGSLSCENGHFVKTEEPGAWLGLNADNAKIGGSVYLRSKVSVDGQISFFAASVGGAFQLWDVQCPETGYLDLRFLKVLTLLNDSKSWPRPGNLLVDGFVYDQIDERADLNAQAQLRWLHLQPHDRFLSHPFDQLASVFRKMGLEEDACQVMIAKNEEHARYVQGQPEWLWYGCFGKLIGYGYSPWRAFFVSLVVVGIGLIFFLVGFHTGLITPTSDDGIWHCKTFYAPTI